MSQTDTHRVDGRKSGVESHARMPGELRMSREQMLDLGHRALELLVGRIENLPGENAWDGEFRQVLEDQLLEDPPEDGRPADEVIESVTRDVLPLTVRLDHPRCFGFVPSSPTWPGVVADFVAAGYNINQCTWLVASGPSQLELVVIDWFRRWLGYPEGAGGLFTSGGSAASVNAFVAAREAAGHPERATVYMSDQSHSALARAAMIVGVRRECVRMIPSDTDFRLDMDALARAVAEDRDAGFTPVAVAANAGTAGTGAIDRLEAMADFCEVEGLWLHVDAAYGGFAIVTERGQQLLRGIERADSIGLDAHKWFYQPYEAGCLLVKDENTLKDAFAVRPDILQDTVWGANHPNISDLGLQLSRSMRALKVWMSVQTFGMATFRRAIDKVMELSARAEAYVRESPVLEAMNTATLGIVCFRVNPVDDDLDEAALEKVNRAVLVRMFWDDPAFMSSTLLQGTFALRMCIINHTTTWDDVRETLEAVERFGKEALAVSDTPE
ncbi:MAG: aminotransferase class V-fold PLP-dependent enzyme [Paracoccaceae bacterium]|nr:aminotransferase class V-fold PLP-dependent enzyme [Paracoccaceae bacterium]